LPSYGGSVSATRAATSVGRGEFFELGALLSMPLPDLQPVEHRGELIAVVSRERVHIIAPRLLALPAADPELKHAVYMATLCSLQLAAEQPLDSEAAAAWADQELDHEDVNAVGTDETG
jgi:hypothetical protein